MVVKTITYTDYNGTERTEEFRFNLTTAEMAEMAMSTSGGLAAMIEQIVSTQDMPAIMKLFKDFIMKAYGEKSLDGKKFVKVDKDGYKLANDFVQTEAYNVLFMELIRDVNKASAFFNEIIQSGDNKPAPATN